MKKQFLVIFLGVLGSIVFAQAPGSTPSYDTSLLAELKVPYNIKSYFLLLPESALETLPGDTLDTQARQKLLSGEIAPSDYWQLDVLDYRNGFMKFHTNSDGEGAIIEITYFILQDRSRIIAVGRTFWDMCCESSHLNFYRFENDIWEDITNQVVPEIRLNHFLADSAAIFGYEAEWIAKPPLQIKLPQKGKNITVKLGMDSLGEIRDYEEIDPAFWEIFDKHLYRQEIILQWNAGNFVLPD